MFCNNSNFDITSENICYNSYQESIQNDPDFIKNHPKCMACSIHPISKYENTHSWKTTKTNIEHVCLYNPSADTIRTITFSNGTLLNFSAAGTSTTELVGFGEIVNFTKL